MLNGSSNLKDNEQREAKDETPFRNNNIQVWICTPVLVVGYQVRFHHATEIPITAWSLLQYISLGATPWMY